MAFGVEYAGAANSVVSNSSLSSQSFTITNANKLLVVIGHGHSVSAPPSSLTWNGGSSFHANVVDAANVYDGSWNEASIYYLDNPTPGTGVVTASGTSAIITAIAVVTLTDASSGAPAGGEATGTSSSPSVTVAGSSSGDIVISGLMSDLGPSGTTTANGTGVADLEDINSDNDFNVQYQNASGSNTSCSWTQSASDAYAAVAVAVSPASSGSSATPGAGTAEATGLAPIMDRGLLGALGSIVAQTFAPLVNPQYARPSADVSDGGWTPSTGADLYAVIDEASRDDGDYIQSATNPSNDTCTIKLATITLPGTNEGFQLQWAAGAVGATGTVVGSLRQGNSPGTEIASWTHANLPVGSYAEFGDAVTAAQAANITDGSDLYLRIVAS